MWPRFKNTPNCKSADLCGWTGDRDFSLHKVTRIEEFILKNLAIKNNSFTFNTDIHKLDSPRVLSQFHYSCCCNFKGINDFFGKMFLKLTILTVNLVEEYAGDFFK
jgi:hypothetical protein